MRFDTIKKILVLPGIAIIISFSSIVSLKAQPGGGGITQILTQILQRVNNLPAALVNLGAYTSAWMGPDTSTTTSTMQQSFTQLGNLLTQDINTQNSLQTSLNANLLNNDGNSVYNMNNSGMGGGSKDPASSINLPYANDLVYSSLLDIPYFAKDPRSTGGAQGKKIDYALNYIINASGANLYHIRPGNSWQGKADSQTRYQSFYNTVMAATSFNGYALSDVYADKNQFTTLQQTLIQQASDPKEWFAQVSSENIGFVLRQLLLYQSQVFVLLTQVIQLQKQMVAAQAINNAVLVAVNQTNEKLLVSGAKGESPSL